jgi:hypothetical protein
VYSVALAAYNLFPAFIGHPRVIEVYAGPRPAVVTTATPRLGDTLRFYGAVFFEQGTLRMDCAEISEGVTALSLSANPLIS